MLLLFATALSIGNAATQDFPERVPGMMEACLSEAVAAGDVTDTDDSHKYLCAGEAARRLWEFLERAKINTYEQDTPEGRWMGREFPLGACFKRTRMPDGGAARNGLSCTIWVPRLVDSKAVSKE